MYHKHINNKTMSTNQDNNIDMNRNSHASLPEYLMDSLSSENNKRNRGMNDEISFGNGLGPSMKRPNTSFETAQQTMPAVLTPSITQNTMPNFSPFFGNGGNSGGNGGVTQSSTQHQQPQQHYPNPTAAAHMMNQQSNPASVHAAAAHAAMTAFIAQHMMASSGQHHPQIQQPQVHQQFNPHQGNTAAAAVATQQKNTSSQSNNPMQNFMASYASMMHGAASAATVTQGSTTLNNNNNTADNTALQSSSEVSCPAPPAGNISTVATSPAPGSSFNLLSRDASNNHNVNATAPNTPAMNLQMPTQHAFAGLNNSPSSSMMNLNNNQVVSTVTSSTPIPSPNKLPVVGGSGSVNTSLIHGASTGTNSGSQSGNKLIGLPQSLATNPFLNMRDLSLEELGKYS